MAWGKLNCRGILITKFALIAWAKLLDNFAQFYDSTTAVKNKYATYVFPCYRRLQMSGDSDPTVTGEQFGSDQIRFLRVYASFESCFKHAILPIVFRMSQISASSTSAYQILEWTAMMRTARTPK